MSPEISWHRGGRELAQSASLEAFLRAAEHAAEWIEVDVRQTADGELVCVHDMSVPNLGKVSELNYACLSLADRLAVPTFAEFLEALWSGGELAGNSLGSGVHLDLKGAGYELQTIEPLLASGRPFLVTTSNEASIALIRDAHPGVQAMLSLPRMDWAHGLTKILTMGLQDLWPYGRLRASRATGVAVQYSMANPLFRRWCRRHDITILVWTVDSTRGLRRWLAKPDVAIVTTNRPVAANHLRQGLVGARTG